ncbi:hypothetical protein THAR02_10505 [Trichoderma harzianum]|uniref:Uncharacterized protein n=1 Tax=Trichoderma harzianum TaxID=5544 RepID=A0A0F9WW58_TRIHA|nr:hypothetical protein THAR02_10505 [Trichoderma harzianum]
MNMMWFFLAIFISFVQQSCAYGERGIAERGLYYIAYLAEGELYKLDKSTKLTIAPGCIGAKGGRSFTKFMHVSIWAPKEENARKPSNVKPDTITGLGDLDKASAFNTYIKNIEKARFNTEEHLSGEIDVKKLMPGKKDFYDALSSAGDPIGALAAEVDKQKKATKPDDEKALRKLKKQDNLLKWGEAAAFYVSALRGKDQDKHRRSFLEKYFERHFPAEEDKNKIKIEMMDVETPMMQKKLNEDKVKQKGKVPASELEPQTVLMIDFTKTIEQNKGRLDGFEEKLKEANEAFMGMEKTVNGKVEKFNEAHKKAFMASKMATSATGCTRKIPRELKKRNALAELSSRSPKAAKSMRVKSQKLGFSM